MGSIYSKLIKNTLKKFNVINIIRCLPVFIIGIFKNIKLFRKYLFTKLMILDMLSLILTLMRTKFIMKLVCYDMKFTGKSKYPFINSLFRVPSSFREFFIATGINFAIRLVKTYTENKRMSVVFMTDRQKFKEEDIFTIETLSRLPKMYRRILTKNLYEEDNEVANKETKAMVTGDSIFLKKHLEIDEEYVRQSSDIIIRLCALSIHIATFNFKEIKGNFVKFNICSLITLIISESIYEYLYKYGDEKDKNVDKGRSNDGQFSGFNHMKYVPKNLDNSMTTVNEYKTWIYSSEEKQYTDNKKYFMKVIGHLIINITKLNVFNSRYYYDIMRNIIEIGNESTNMLNMIQCKEQDEKYLNSMPLREILPEKKKCDSIKISGIKMSYDVKKINHSREYKYKPAYGHIYMYDYTFIVKKSTSFILEMEGLPVILKKGDKIEVRGNNGCGKTTLYNILNGVILPQNSCNDKNADVMYDYCHYNVEMRNGMKETWVPCNFEEIHSYMMPQLEDISLTGTVSVLLKNNSKYDKIINNFKLEEIFSICGLNRYKGTNDEIFKMQTEERSGGIIQRFRLVKAMYDIVTTNPFIVIFDEPNNHVDRTFPEMFKKLLKFINADDRIIFITDHNHDFGFNWLIEFTDNKFKFITK